MSGVAQSLSMLTNAVNIKYMLIIFKCQSLSVLRKENLRKGVTVL